ncbi:hypothetical protein D3C80_1823950 [compost metagenome]
MADWGIKLLGNEELLSKMKENAYNRAHSFTIDKIVPQYEALYNRVIDEYKKSK